MSIVKKYLLNEVRLKILAIALAGALWLSMTYVGESKIALSVPVSFNALHRNLLIRETDTKDVLITVNGPLSLLKSLSAKDVKVLFDLSRVREGRHIMTIQKGDIVVPTGVKIEDVKPDYIVVEIDKIVEKRLRTIVKLDKKWIGVYDVSSWHPRYVEAEGPKELLEKRDYVETLPVDGDFSRQQEVLDIPLNTKSLEVKKMRPEAVRVILRRSEK
ncbi:MAG: hypothetical protein A4E57_01119 [Syntrophorhabdaceae bacterium PtaU1.Bin034]|jgi:YbbR domain-containing protein|nr:MAG: hypothetical protein A4E57_01119 [Syntrophorhabdaceae bacterium PtaU1.Bin034]